MTVLRRFTGLARRCINTNLNGSQNRAFSASLSVSAPEAGAEANKFSLDDTQGVSIEEFADTYPDAFIMKVFRHQQDSFRRYLAEAKDIEVPEDPDSQEFADYLTDMEKLKAASGLPSALDLSEAQVASMAMASDNSFRKFLGLATEGADPDQSQEGWDAIRGALDEVEAAEGPVPLTGDGKAAQAFSQKIKEVSAKFQEQEGSSPMTEIINAYCAGFEQFSAGRAIDGEDDLSDDDLADMEEDENEYEYEEEDGNDSKEK